MYIRVISDRGTITIISVKSFFPRPHHRQVHHSTVTSLPMINIAIEQIYGMYGTYS